MLSMLLRVFDVTAVAQLNMASLFLFWCVLVNAFAYAFISVIVKMILAVIFRRERSSITHLKNTVKSLRSDLNRVNMVDEFPKHAKIQRKILELTERMSRETEARIPQMSRIKLIASVLLHLICGTSAVYLIWNYRYVPVLKVPEEWLYPLNKLTAFPMHSTGDIGVTMWLAISCTVAKHIIGNMFQ